MSHRTLALFGVLIVPVLGWAADPSPRARLRSEKGEWVELEVKECVSANQGASNAVLLRPKGEELVLPIFIGDAEATAIRLRLSQRAAPRPLTHDLLEVVIRSLGARVVKIHIDDLKDGVFLGKVFLAQGDRTLELDARPSDSIALALGTKAQIYAARKVLVQAGMSPRDFEGTVKKRPARRGEAADTPADL